MKRLFLSLAVFVMALCANAQKNQYFWFNGNLMMGNPIAQIDSVTFGEGEPADTLHILLPRTIIKEVHDTVYITIHDTVCPNDIPEGALNGLFSVSADKKVRFSKGNLQYQASTDTWRFAENQYDYIGEGNSNISPTYSGWIDLFGWGTGSNPTNISSNDADYQNFVDWGINSIEHSPSNTWRTLSNDEYNYLFNLRENANSLYGQATVNNVYGLVILPDNFILPTGLNFVPIPNNWNQNVYTLSSWKLMEENGAVFLPAAGWRGIYIYGEHNYHSDGSGSYWSSTSISSSNQYYLLFDNYVIYPTSSFIENTRGNGHSVRLVHNIE